MKFVFKKARQKEGHTVTKAYISTVNGMFKTPLWKIKTTSHMRIYMNKLIAAFVATLFAGAAFAQTPATTVTKTTTVPATKAEVKADAKVDKTEAKADAKDDKMHAKAHAKAEKKIFAAEKDVKKAEVDAAKK
jgi:hypothetical protein